MKIKRSTFLIFVVAIVIVILTQFFLLKPIINYQLFSSDDWMWLTIYHSIQLPLPLKLVRIWTSLGMYEGSYLSYIGILSDLLGKNYQAYQYLNIFLKILATITLFPMLIILFRNRLLAFLTTILYGINAASIGSFPWFFKGGVFASITFMNLFFISYYYTIIKKSKSLLTLSSILVFLSFLSSPTRIYPLFFLIILFEAFWFYMNRSLNNIKFSLIRVLCFFLPTIFVITHAGVTPDHTVAREPLILLNDILKSGWYNLLSPLNGIGFSLVNNEVFRYFGSISINSLSSLSNYLLFLLQGCLWILLICTMILSAILSRRYFRFFLSVFVFNFIFEILMFFVATKHLNIFPPYNVSYDPNLFFITIYASLIGIYVLTTSLESFLEWKRETTNSLLAAVWLGPLFSLVFTFLMWFPLGYALNGYNSTHYYFQIPAIGMALFLSAVLAMMYEKCKNTKITRFFAIFLICMFVLTFYQSSKRVIYHDFIRSNQMRVKINDQQILHDKLWDKLGDRGKSGDILIYIELPQDKELANYYKEALLFNGQSLAAIINWRRDPKNSNGCVEIVNDKNILKSTFSKIDNHIIFNITKAYCVSKALSPYEIKSLYAFKIENGDFVDIKDDLLKEFR